MPPGTASRSPTSSSPYSLSPPAPGWRSGCDPPVSPSTLRRLAVRSLALIAIGVVVFSWWGEGGGLDSLRIPGVLQRIGVAGLVAGVIIVGVRRWWAIAAVAAVLLVGYGWTLSSPTVDGCRGVDVPACTVPGAIDTAAFGSAHLYRDGTAGYDPEGLPSTAGAVVSVLIGWLAGDLLRRRRLVELAGLGAVCFVTGVLWSHAIEVNKRLWTPSFTLVTGAISIGLLLLAHLLVDRPGIASRAAWPIVALGRNALVVYVGQHIVGVWLSRVHVGDVTASTWLLEHVVQRSIAPPGAYLVYALGMLAAVDSRRLRAARAPVVRHAVRRRLLCPC